MKIECQIPEQELRAAREAVRRMPPMTSEDLDAVAEAFRQQDEEARQARVAARLSSSSGTTTGGGGNADAA